MVCHTGLHRQGTGDCTAVQGKSGGRGGGCVRSAGGTVDQDPWGEDADHVKAVSGVCIY